MPASVTRLPALSGPRPLPGASLEACRAKGHLTVRGLCTPEEIAGYRDVIAREVERRRDSARGGVYRTPLAERDTRHRAFLQLTNLWADSEAVARFTLAERMGHVAAQLLEVEAVRVYHDQALFKEPGGGYTPWHQDQFYWPLESGRTITMWMPLTPMGAEMGTLIFADGSHREGALADLGISDHSEAHYRALVREREIPLSISELEAGDATWHYGWTLHKSPGNTTDRMREVMTVIYVADDTRITEPDNAAQEKDLATWMPGQRPGDRVGSPLNPQVWPAPTD